MHELTMNNYGNDMQFFFSFWTSPISHAIYTNLL